MRTNVNGTNVGNFILNTGYQYTNLLNSPKRTRNVLKKIEIIMDQSVV